VTPAVGAVAGQVDVMIIGPVQRAVTASTPHGRDATTVVDPTEPPGIDGTTST
jgi:hypothetical protein